MQRFVPNGSSETPHLLKETIPTRTSLDAVGNRFEGVLAMWFGWSDDAGGLPDWSSFNPMEYPHLLPHISVYKPFDDDYRCVLIGEDVKNRMERKVQGELIRDAFPVKFADALVMRFNRALVDKLPSYTEETMAWNNGRSFVRYRSLHLPFTSARDGHDRILSFYEFDF